MKFRSLIAIALLGAPAAFALAQDGVRNVAYGDSEYRLGPDDVIQVFVWKEPELSTTVTVRPDGKLSAPIVGELPATGKTSLQLQEEITRRLAEYIAEPMVNVIVQEVNSAQVSILGEVRNPGSYKIRNRATLLDAVALAGGFTEYARRNRVTVIRSNADGTPQRFTLNVDDFIRDPRVEFYVLPYDRIYVQ